jgi:hypothetical protein
VKPVDAVVVVELVVGAVCVMSALAIDGVMTKMVERIRSTAPSHEAILAGYFHKLMCET